MGDQVAMTSSFSVQTRSISPPTEPPVVVERKRLDVRLRVGRRFLHRAEQPLVAFAGGARQNLLGCLQFLLGLVLLQQVDVEPAFLHVIDDGAPGERHAGGVVEPRERAVVGGKKDQAVAAVARFGSVVADASRAQPRTRGAIPPANTSSQAEGRQGAGRCRPARRREA